MRRRPPLAVLPFLLHTLAREVDRALGLVLQGEVEPDGLPREVGRALGADGAGVVTRVVVWLAVWLLACIAVGWWGRRAGGARTDADADKPTVVVWPLLLRPAITLLALVSVAFKPGYPYAFTLPVVHGK